MKRSKFITSLGVLFVSAFTLGAKRPLPKRTSFTALPQRPAHWPDPLEPMTMIRQGPEVRTDGTITLGWGISSRGRLDSKGFTRHAAIFSDRDRRGDYVTKLRLLADSIETGENAALRTETLKDKAVGAMSYAPVDREETRRRYGDDFCALGAPDGFPALTEAEKKEFAEFCAKNSDLVRKWRDTQHEMPA